MSVKMNTTVNAWMLHPWECSCTNCTNHRHTHRDCRTNPCGLKSCWERIILMEDGEIEELV
jgi:hypothetical protein